MNKDTVGGDRSGFFFLGGGKDISNTNVINLTCECMEIKANYR